MPIRPEMKARYPKDWKLRSRFIRFYRGHNKCEWCGAENHKPHPITGSKVVFGAMMIEQKIEETEQAMANGDTVKMLACYKKLQESQ